MSIRESNYSDRTLSHFSTALLKANDAALLKENGKDKNLQYKGDGTVNTSPNSNLSNLLSQIQDDGPARTDSVKRNNFFNQAKNNDTASVSQQETGLNSADVLPVFSSELRQGGRTNSDISEKKINTSIWFLSLLILSIAALLALALFKIDLRTSELEESLISYDASLQDSLVSQAQSENVSLSITNINETLQSIRRELQLIETEYEVLDERYTESIANGVAPQRDEVASIKDNVAALTHEIVVLKSQLQTESNDLKTIDKSSADKVVASGGLTVNLASLSNKDKAEKVVKQLHAAGLSPVIQQAVVKGKHVYRLSVRGFSNRDEAELFIRKAGEQYGMKDGWIRKS